MDHIKEAGRNIETETKKKLRDVDGHDLGDDVANARDEVKKDVANTRDRLEREVEEVDDNLDDDLDH